MIIDANLVVGLEWGFGVGLVVGMVLTLLIVGAWRSCSPDCWG